MRFFTTLTSSLTVAEFAAKPFIKKACENPSNPPAILSFFYGEDYYDTESSHYVDAMREGRPLRTMSSLWYGGGDEYDNLCRHFIPVIRDLGKQQRYQQQHQVVNNENNDDDEQNVSSSPSISSDLWNGSVDGVMAQVICFDQLSRNCFRGNDEAYAYEQQSIELVRQIYDDKYHQSQVSPSPTTTTTSLTGELLSTVRIVIGCMFDAFRKHTGS
jgi:Bacterial protein of unknown function (DUF924)